MLELRCYLLLPEDPIQASSSFAFQYYFKKITKIESKHVPIKKLLTMIACLSSDLDELSADQT